MDKNQYFQRFILFLVLSLIVHLGGYGLMSFWAPKQQFDNIDKPIEVTLFDKKPDSQQFVTDPEVGKALKDLKKHAKYLSKLTRRVREEQIARHSGKTKNRVQQKRDEMREKIIKKRYAITADNGILGIKPSQEIRQHPLQGAPLNLPSTISEYIPNVAKGDFTVLNTDQFAYYAFFNRINQQIRFRWVANIRNLAIELPTPTINRLGAFPRNSKVELVLNKKGEFVNVFVDTTSGSEELDQAAMNALIDAAPYIYPPQDLVDGEGYIRLNYAFRVVWSPRYAAKDKSPGN